jgi:hypothetical protein
MRFGTLADLLMNAQHDVASSTGTNPSDHASEGDGLTISKVELCCDRLIVTPCSLSHRTEPNTRCSDRLLRAATVDGGADRTSGPRGKHDPAKVTASAGPTSRRCLYTTAASSLSVDIKDGSRIGIRVGIRGFKLLRHLGDSL